MSESEIITFCSYSFFCVSWLVSRLWPSGNVGSWALLHVYVHQ